MKLAPAWPAIIQHQDEDELIYIHNQDEWKNIATSSEYNFDYTDQLIDANGNIFFITFPQNNSIDLKLQPETLSLETILGLVKAHASQAGSCCVAKLYAPSIRDAFIIVKSLNDD
jgi:hypothetical protein